MLTTDSPQLVQTCNEYFDWFNGDWFSSHHFKIWSVNDFKPFFPGRNLVNYGLKLFSGCSGSIFAFKKRKTIRSTMVKPGSNLCGLSPRVFWLIPFYFSDVRLILQKAFKYFARVLQSYTTQQELQNQHFDFNSIKLVC